MNETTDEHRTVLAVFICGVVQSTPAPKKDFVIQGFFDSRFIRSAKKTPQGRREHRVLCAPAVSRGIYLSLPKLGDRQCRELAGLQADLDHRTDDLSARRLHRQCPLEIMSVGLREQLFQQA